MPSLHWYINRIRTMSVPEVGFRIIRATHNSLEKLGIGLVKNPPQSDIGHRIRILPAFGEGIDVSAEMYVIAAEKIISGKLTIFALEDHQYGPDFHWNCDPMTGTDAPLQYGKTLDYRNADLVGDIKYLWEPNRHLHLVTVAQAYRLTGESKYLDFIVQSIQSWIHQCPYPLGPNWCSSLELAIRLINWMLVWSIVGGEHAFNKSKGEKIFLRNWLNSIYQHCHFITTHFSRYSSAGNHLIGEAAGLYCAASVWNYWPHCDSWRSKAKDILISETIHQTTEDGVTKEQAIAYQQFVLDFLLISGLIGKSTEDKFPDDYWNRIHSMIRFIAAIMDVGHNVPMLGDADDGFVFRLSPDPYFRPYQSLVASGAALFRSPYLKAKSARFDDKSFWMLGESGLKDYNSTPKMSSDNPPLSFPNGGYYILGSCIDAENEVRLLMDTGPLGLKGNAGHGHADALSLLLSVSGHEILVDPGTYAYHTKRKMRDYFRGTSAHNTVRIDGKDQAVSGGTFMWTKHYKARCLNWTSTPTKDQILAEHDGYLRLPVPAIHRRKVCFDKQGNRIVVTDTIKSKASHSIELFWHISNNSTVQLVDRTVHVKISQVEVLITCLEESAEILIARGNLDLPLGWISRSFDIKTPTTTVVFKFKSHNSQPINTIIDIKNK